jgi:hypothetical protein
MDEVKEDVKQSEETSTSEQEVVKESAEQTTAAEDTTTQEKTEQSQEESKPQPQFSAVDEKGVPWMNRYYEEQRKTKELVDNLDTKMSELLSKQSTQAQPKEYSISELELFAINNPEHRPWVEEQKAQVIQKNVSKITQQEIQAVEQKKTAEIKRKDSFNYVVNSYPECFVKDNLGNLQWNNQNPIVQQIGFIMNDPRFKNDPEGLIGAADMAYGRVARMQSSQTQSKVKSLQNNLKKVQRGTMSEGSGKSAVKVQKDEFAAAKERLMTKRNDKDAATAAVKAYLKKYGVIEE